MRYEPNSIATLEIGLLAFALSNLPFFSAAAGVFGDPFVLIICGILFGLSLGSAYRYAATLEPWAPRAGVIIFFPSDPGPCSAPADLLPCLLLACLLNGTPFLMGRIGLLDPTNYKADRQRFCPSSGPPAGLVSACAPVQPNPDHWNQGSF